MHRHDHREGAGQHAQHAPRPGRQVPRIQVPGGRTQQDAPQPEPAFHVHAAPRLHPQELPSAVQWRCRWRHGRLRSRHLPARHPVHPVPHDPPQHGRQFRGRQGGGEPPRRQEHDTPFLLAKIKDITGGDSLDSNIQLVFNNARLAAKVACEMVK
ncbi:MAG: pseudouridine-5'-phosphate glycosidase [Fibrobacter sp.]|nr:pseudouridine-5'-phosphate glycosidase [Fibrobacter sp.]